jgi:hypothetical protein
MPGFALVKAVRAASVTVCMAARVTPDLPATGRQIE